MDDNDSPDDCGIDRRRWIALGGLTLLVSAVDPRLLAAGGKEARGTKGSREGAAAEGRDRTGGKTLVYVFQRFGADGLNTVIPVEPGEHRAYRAYRPTLAVSLDEPGLGRLEGADFALHPVTAGGLHRLWQKGMVAVMPNVGYPDASRSHFDSQLYLDRGIPGDKTARDGWLNRYLQAASDSGDPLRALAFGKSMPASLDGPAPALVLSGLEALSVTSSRSRNQRFLDVAEEVHAEEEVLPGASEVERDIARVGRSLVAGVKAVPPDLPPPGAAYPASDFGKSLAQLAQLLKSGRFAIEVAQVDFGGWDTHARQQDGVKGGVFPDLLRQLSDGIAALVDDLGPERVKKTLVLTASEFGRTARENGSLGTDHGSAWASFAVGGGVRGGVYLGQAGWHGLEHLREDRDLQYSLDFRDVFSEALARHLGTLTPGIFPGWTNTPVGFL